MRELVDADSASLPTASTGGMNPNKAKSFPAASVPAVAKLGHRRRGKRRTRSEERRNTRREHASKQKCRRWRSLGVVGVLHPTRWKNEGKNLGRKHLDMELSEGQRAFDRKKRRGKRAERKAARPHKTQGRQGEVSAGGAHVRHVNVRTAVVKGVNGIDHVDTLLRPCAAKGCGVIGLQEIKRDGTSNIVASGYRAFFSGDCSGVKGRKG